MLLLLLLLQQQRLVLVFGIIEFFLSFFSSFLPLSQIALIFSFPLKLLLLL
jgi:hypothetical protein